MSASTSPRVSATWLHDHLGEVRVVDASVHLTFDADGAHVASGAETFAEAHIPGAVFADLVGPGFTDPAGEGAFAAADSAAFAEAVGALGIGDGDTVVVYDHVNGIWATRLWWQLRLEGHADVRVLDGGLAAWRAAGYPVRAEPAAPAPAVFTPRRDPSLIVSTAEVEAALDDDGVLLLEALPASQYADGHIPGAVNVGFDRLFGADGAFLDPAELRDRFAEVGSLEPGARVVTYCGGGIAATAAAFALAELGRDDVAVYDGSKTAWTADPARPLERA